MKTIAKCVKSMKVSKPLLQHCVCRWDSESVISEEYLRGVIRKIKPREDEEIEGKLDSEPLKEIREKKISKRELVTPEKVKFVDETRNIVSTRNGEFYIPEFYRHKFKGKFSSLIYLQNNTKSNYIRKIYKEERGALLFFGAELNFYNCRNLLESYYKKVGEFYFDEKRLARLEARDIGDQAKLATVYNDTVRKIIELRSFMTRFMVAVNNDLSLRNDEAPQISSHLAKYLEFTQILTKSMVIRGA